MAETLKSMCQCPTPHSRDLSSMATALSISTHTFLHHRRTPGLLHLRYQPPPLLLSFRLGSKRARRAVRADAQAFPSSFLPRPGSIVESDRIPSGVRDSAMAAVDHFGGRVTAGDVASRAGIKLNEAERALQALAADTEGFLEVSSEGEVLYVFPKDYRSKLLGKSFKMKVEPLLQKGKEATAYLIRVSFGTALIASILLVFTTIVVILTSSSRDSSSSSSDDDRSRRRKGSFDFNLRIFPSDMVWFWDANYYRHRSVEAENGDNFFESVFSFVFGDGDPNQGLEAERWKLIGQYISANGGVVAAEELAPYLDVPADQLNDDDSYILPVLLRFEGHPEVDEQGQILYRFPSLQVTASAKNVGRREYVGRKRPASSATIEKFLSEKTWQFSKTSFSGKAMAIGLGALNLFGVIILGAMLKEMTVMPEGLIPFVAKIFPLLQAYAASFLVIPFFRSLLIVKKNNEITKRNKARQQWAKELESPGPFLTKKLLSARDAAQRKVVTADEVVYNTQKDIWEQNIDTTDFERRFRELEEL